MAGWGTVGLEGAKELMGPSQNMALPQSWGFGVPATCVGVEPEGAGMGDPKSGPTDTLVSVTPPSINGFGDGPGLILLRYAL